MSNTLTNKNIILTPDPNCPPGQIYLTSGSNIDLSKMGNSGQTLTYNAGNQLTFWSTPPTYHLQSKTGERISVSYEEYQEANEAIFQRLKKKQQYKKDFQDIIDE
jgi:hypothetical protein